MVWLLESERLLGSLDGQVAGGYEDWLFKRRRLGFWKPRTPENGQF